MSQIARDLELLKLEFSSETSCEATINRFRRKLVPYASIVERMKHSHFLSLTESSLKYIDCLQKFSVTCDDTSVNRRKVVKNLLVLAEIAKPEKALTYIKQLLPSILERILDPGACAWFNKLLCRLFISIVQSLSSTVRVTIIENSFFMCKICDLILTCGDYDYQSFLLEILIRMNSLDMIKGRAKEWFFENTLRTALVNFNFAAYDVSSTKFLQLLNNHTKKVLPINVISAFLDDNPIIPVIQLEPNNPKVIPVYFNKNARTIDIQCAKLSFKPSNSRILNTSWEVVTILNDNVLYVNPQLIMEYGIKYYKFNFSLKGENICLSELSEEIRNAKQLILDMHEEDGEALLNILPSLFNRFDDNEDAEVDLIFETTQKENEKVLTSCNPRAISRCSTISSGLKSLRKVLITDHERVLTNIPDSSMQDERVSSAIDVNRIVYSSPEDQATTTSHYHTAKETLPDTAASRFNKSTMKELRTSRQEKSQMDKIYSSLQDEQDIIIPESLDTPEVVSRKDLEEAFNKCQISKEKISKCMMLDDFIEIDFAKTSDVLQHQDSILSSSDSEYNVDYYVKLSQQMKEKNTRSNKRVSKNSDLDDREILNVQSKGQQSIPRKVSVNTAEIQSDSLLTERVFTNSKIDDFNTSSPRECNKQNENDSFSMDVQTGSASFLQNNSSKYNEKERSKNTQNKNGSKKLLLEDNLRNINSKLGKVNKIAENLERISIGKENVLDTFENNEDIIDSSQVDLRTQKEHLSTRDVIESENYCSQVFQEDTFIISDSYRSTKTTPRSKNNNQNLNDGGIGDQMPIDDGELQNNESKGGTIEKAKTLPKKIVRKKNVNKVDNPIIETTRKKNVNKVDNPIIETMPDIITSEPLTELLAQNRKSLRKKRTPGLYKSTDFNTPICPKEADNSNKYKTNRNTKLIENDTIDKLCKKYNEVDEDDLANKPQKDGPKEMLIDDTQEPVDKLREKKPGNPNQANLLDKQKSNPTQVYDIEKQPRELQDDITEAIPNLEDEQLSNALSDQEFEFGIETRRRTRRLTKKVSARKINKTKQAKEKKKILDKSREEEIIEKLDEFDKMKGKDQIVDINDINKENEKEGEKIIKKNLSRKSTSKKNSRTEVPNIQHEEVVNKNESVHVEHNVVDSINDINKENEKEDENIIKKNLSRKSTSKKNSRTDEVPNIQHEEVVNENESVHVEHNVVDNIINKTNIHDGDNFNLGENVEASNIEIAKFNDEVSSAKVAIIEGKGKKTKRTKAAKNKKTGKEYTKKGEENTNPMMKNIQDEHTTSEVEKINTGTYEKEANAKDLEVEDNEHQILKHSLKIKLSGLMNLGNNKQIKNKPRADDISDQTHLTADIEKETNNGSKAIEKENHGNLAESTEAINSFMAEEPPIDKDADVATFQKRTEDPIMDNRSENVCEVNSSCPVQEVIEARASPIDPIGTSSLSDNNLDVDTRCADDENQNIAVDSTVDADTAKIQSPRVREPNHSSESNIIEKSQNAEQNNNNSKNVPSTSNKVPIFILPQGNHPEGSNRKIELKDNNIPAVSKKSLQKANAKQDKEKSYIKLVENKVSELDNVLKNKEWALKEKARLNHDNDMSKINVSLNSTTSLTRKKRKLLNPLDYSHLNDVMESPNSDESQEEESKQIVTVAEIHQDQINKYQNKNAETETEGINKTETTENKKKLSKSQNPKQHVKRTANQSNTLQIEKHSTSNRPKLSKPLKIEKRSTPKRIKLQKKTTPSSRMEKLKEFMSLFESPEKPAMKLVDSQESSNESSSNVPSKRPTFLAKKIKSEARPLNRKLFEDDRTPATIITEKRVLRKRKITEPQLLEKKSRKDTVDQETDIPCNLSENTVVNIPDEVLDEANTNSFVDEVPLAGDFYNGLESPVMSDKRLSIVLEWLYGEKGITKGNGESLDFNCVEKGVRFCQNLQENLVYMTKMHLNLLGSFDMTSQEVVRMHKTLEDIYNRNKTEKS